LESRQKGGTWDRRLSLDDGLNVGLVTEKSVRVRIHDEMAPSNIRCFNSLLSRFF
jgi:CYTH domain-containing protein